jgi:hypothetical protein
MGPAYALHGHWPGLVTMLIIFTFCMQWLVLSQEGEENLLDTRGNSWLVIWEGLSWRWWWHHYGDITKKERKIGGEEKKNRDWGEASFLPILDPNLFSSNAWNPPLFIGGGRGTLCLFWKKILALDSNRKDPNCWFKVVIMVWKSWQLKATLSCPFKGYTAALRCQSTKMNHIEV